MNSPGILSVTKLVAIVPAETFFFHVSPWGPLSMPQVRLHVYCCKHQQDMPCTSFTYIIPALTHHLKLLVRAQAQTVRASAIQPSIYRPPPVISLPLYRTTFLPHPRGQAKIWVTRGQYGGGGFVLLIVAFFSSSCTRVCAFEQREECRGEGDTLLCCPPVFFCKTRRKKRRLFRQRHI